TDINNLDDMVPSPDGRRVAYSQMGTDGALYLRDLASGAVELLAPGLPAAWNWSPVWSPDGRRLAYYAGDQQTRGQFIKIMDVASHQVVATFPVDVPRWRLADWSRDGRYLLSRRPAPTRSGPASLVLIAVGSGTMTTLVDTVARWPKASFSPDGRFVTYTAGQGESTNVFVQAVAGGERRQITDAPGSGFSVWSPDGRAIAYRRANGIWVVPVLNGAVNGTPRLAYANEAGHPTAWTEAGGLYLVAYNSESVPYQIAVDSATGQPGAAGAQEVRGHPDGLSQFAWSPDMRRIAYAGMGEITIYAADRQTLTRYEVSAQGIAWDLWWSADGREVLSAPDVRSRPGTVLALDPSTGRVREPFPPVASVGSISLSADGRRVVFRRRAADPNASELVVAEAGRTDGPVVAAPADAEGAPLSNWVRPRFSPRGDRVLYGRQADLVTGQASPRAGALWVVGSDGSGARRIGAVPLIWSAVWDPSARFIAYTGSDRGRAVLRVVDVATGVEHDVALPNPGADLVRVTDWSPDGTHIGIVSGEARWEYWVVQGLLEDAR
ncbi:MAG: hypothetical protein Q8Q85_12410, partial [Gemmatimonadales bacterium]|nr:hypothetical protein [Gemmatimonadales bacterium]